MFEPSGKLVNGRNAIMPFWIFALSGASQRPKTLSENSFYCSNLPLSTGNCTQPSMFHSADIYKSLWQFISGNNR